MELQINLKKMKAYVEENGAVIQYGLYPTVKGDYKDGEIVEHSPIVDEVFFYHRIYENDQERYIKISLKESFISEVNAKIQELKNTTKMCEFDSLPF